MDVKDDDAAGATSGEGDVGEDASQGEGGGYVPLRLNLDAASSLSSRERQAH